MTDITVYCEAGDGKTGRLRYQLQLSSDPTICSFNHNFLRIFIFWVKHYTKNYDIYLISGESEHKNFNIFYWTNTVLEHWAGTAAVTSILTIWSQSRLKI